MVSRRALQAATGLLSAIVQTPASGPMTGCAIGQTWRPINPWRIAALSFPHSRENPYPQGPHKGQNQPKRRSRGALKEQNIMTHWETIRTETVDGFDIVFSVTPEDEDPRVQFDDEGETAKAIADGRYAWFVARVEARRRGITLGVDYLGGCCYDSPQQFVDSGGYYSDMIANAVAEAEDILTKI